MDFSKINTGKKSLDNLVKALNKTKLVKTDYSDDTEWSLSKDKDGNGQAKIRFVPSSDGEYFIEVRNHGFKLNGGWFIDNCPKTLDWDNPCPVCEHGEGLKKGREWDKIPKAEQDAIKPFFAKTSYFANVLVEVDPANPENEGKIFKFRFGKKILEKIAGRAQDDPLDGTEGINVFDVLEGASFKIKCKKVAGYLNYDDSAFENPSKLCKGDVDKIDALLATGPALAKLGTTENFKSYADLKKRLVKLLGEDAPPAARDYQKEDKAATPDVPDLSKETDEDDTDDSFSYFKNLAESEDVPF